MKIKSIRPIEPRKSLCISVDSSDKLFSVGKTTDPLLTHNSVAQQNIILSCLLRPEHWVILGIDLKRVELTRFREYGMNVAADVGPAVDFLRFAQAVMMKRYERMEELGVNNFQKLPVPGQALLVMIDEAGELLSPSGGKSDEAKAEDDLKAEATMIIGSIARLGRAAGVHLVVATQRPDAKLIPGETRDNLAVRLGCGTMKPTASSMLFDSNAGARTPSDPPGGIYLQIHGKGNRGQGFFADDDWLEDFYTNNPDRRPVIGEDGKITYKDEDMKEVPDGEDGKESFTPLDEWDEDMEAIMDAED